VETQNQADTKFVFANNQAKLVLNKKIANVASISIELVVNPEKIKIKKEDLISDYSLSPLSVSDDGSVYNIILTDIGALKKSDSILTIT